MQYSHTQGVELIFKKWYNNYKLVFLILFMEWCFCQFLNGLKMVKILKI